VTEATGRAVARSDEAALAGTAEPAASATRSQIRGSSILMSGRVITLVANLLVQVLIVRALSKADYGVFAYGLAFTTTARIFVTLGHNRTITRFLAIYEERRAYDKLFGTLVMEVGTIAATSAVMLGGMWLFRDGLGSALLDHPRALTILFIILLLAPIEALDDLVEGVFAVFADARAIFVRKYVVAPVLRISVVLAIVLTGHGPVALALGYVAASAVGVLFYVTLLRRVLRRRRLLEHFDRRRLSYPFREVFGFSFPLLSTELVHVSMNTIGVMLLGAYGGAASVAAFRAVRPAAVLNLFIMRSFSLLFMPLASRLYARDDREGMRDAYWRTAVWLTVFTFPVFAMTVVFAEPMVVMLFGERYRGSAPYLALLAFGYYFNVSLGFNALVLQVVGRLRYLVGVNVGVAVANVGLSVLLIPRHGALGLAVANCVTLVLQNVLNQAGLGRGVEVGVFTRDYLRVYGSVVVAATSLAVASLTLRPGFVLSLTLSSLGSALVFAANRDLLRLGETFPELLRLPLIRRLVGGRTERQSDPSVRVMVAPGEPTVGDEAVSDGGRGDSDVPDPTRGSRR
jgi:O-antigen/teichoic acid export membrane protein